MLKGFFSRRGLTTALALALAGTASADFAAQFDSYITGTQLQNVDGWKGWDNVGSSAGLVSNDFFFTGTNSLKVHGYTDAVQTFSGVDSGIWSLSAKQYIASGQSGLTYFILMNRYVDGANNDSGMWSTQLRFDLGAGLVYDDFRGGSLAIAANQWADIRIDINLTANTVQSYYNNQLLSAGSWTTSGTSALALAAVDLYSADNNSAYYDNMALTGVPTPGGAAIGMAGLIVVLRRKREVAPTRG